MVSSRPSRFQKGLVGFKHSLPGLSVSNTAGQFHTQSAGFKPSRMVPNGPSQFQKGLVGFKHSLVGFKHSLVSFNHNQSVSNPAGWSQTGLVGFKKAWSVSNTAWSVSNTAWSVSITISRFQTQQDGLKRA